jgi:hypothetical protein
MLILSQLFKIDYFLKADAMFQEKAEDIYESSGSLRVHLEKKHFGISHPELGCWLLHYFGLNEDYAKAVLFHEEEDVEAREERYPFLINTSRRIARLVLMDDKFKKFYDGKNTLEIEHNFATTNLRTKYTIYSLLDNHLGLVQKEADKVITDVAYRIKKHSENISGNISLLMEKDFLDALSSISANRDKAIRKLASLLDTEIGSRLPQPAAALYKKIANPKAGAMEYPTMITNILSMFIRVLSSISLCLLLYSYGQRGFIHGRRFRRDWRRGRSFFDGRGRLRRPAASRRQPDSRGLPGNPRQPCNRPVCPFRNGNRRRRVPDLQDPQGTQDRAEQRRAVSYPETLLGTQGVFQPP